MRDPNASSSGFSGFGDPTAPPSPTPQRGSGGGGYQQPQYQQGPPPQQQPPPAQHQQNQWQGQPQAAADESHTRFKVENLPSDQRDEHIAACAALPLAPSPRARSPSPCARLLVWAQAAEEAGAAGSLAPLMGRAGAAQAGAAAAAAQLVGHAVHRARLAL